VEALESLGAAHGLWHPVVLAAKEVREAGVLVFQARPFREGVRVGQVHWVLPEAQPAAPYH